MSWLKSTLSKVRESGGALKSGLKERTSNAVGQESATPTGTQTVSWVVYKLFPVFWEGHQGVVWGCLEVIWG